VCFSRSYKGFCTKADQADKADGFEIIILKKKLKYNYNKVLQNSWCVQLPAIKVMDGLDSCLTTI
jgi:hypothetical protein